MANRPKDEEELQKREVVGVFHASRFVREYAKLHKPINVEAISRIHHEIFKDVWPEIAGVYRKENLTITGSEHVPPHWSRVPERMLEVKERMQEYVTQLETAEGMVLEHENMDKERLAVI